MKKGLLFSALLAVAFMSAAGQEALLMTSIETGNFNQVCSALDSGANPNTVGNDGRPPLIAALQSIQVSSEGKIDLRIAELLVIRGADVVKPLQWGMPALFHLLDCCAVWNAPEYDAFSCNLNSKGLSAMDMNAVRSLALLMIEHGAKTSFADPATGDTALMLAVPCRDLALVKLLVHNGADPAAANQEGQTAAEIALQLADALDPPCLNSFKIQYLEIAEYLAGLN
ncbi:MAG: hypothetical protein PHQ23_08825 [Candidatus Wallbacteria bacterium]|nr:hypothetical protein [Candidatus Wallbacteria bacterium]